MSLGFQSVFYKLLLGVPPKHLSFRPCKLYTCSRFEVDQVFSKRRRKRELVHPERGTLSDRVVDDDARHLLQRSRLGVKVSDDVADRALRRRHARLCVQDSQACVDVGVVHGHEVEANETTEAERGIVAPELVLLHEELDKLVEDEGATGRRGPVVVVVVVLAVLVVVRFVVVVVFATRSSAENDYRNFMVKIPTSQIAPNKKFSNTIFFKKI